jgi:hypothetical protein
MYIQIYGQAEFSFISPEPSKKIHPSQASKRSTKSSLAAETRQTRPSCTYGTGTYRYIGRLVFLWRDLIYIYRAGVHMFNVDGRSFYVRYVPRMYKKTIDSFDSALRARAPNSESQIRVRPKTGQTRTSSE